MDSALKLRESLIERINTISDVQLLETLNSLINAEGYYELSAEQIAAVEESQNQIKQGNFVENEKALNQLKTWLKNQ